MPRGTIVGDGNSIMAGHPAAYVTNGFFAKAKADLNYGSAVTWVNTGQDGMRTDQLITRAATTVDVLYGAGPNNLLVVNEFTNDFLQGLCAGVHAFNRMRRYCAERKLKGWKVIVCTMMPLHDVSAAGLEPERQALNTLLRTWYTSFADGIADFGADAQMGLEANIYPASNLSYFAADGVHPVQGGHDRLAAVLEPVIQSLVI